ncbi:MAG: hypothetical protein F6K14_32870 [Symploca sp. SIO2C1]|nr:hypothetical protein [Symploca sp. SIO2C1]
MVYRLQTEVGISTNLIISKAVLEGRGLKPNFLVKNSLEWQHGLTKRSQQKKYYQVS